MTLFKPSSTTKLCWCSPVVPHIHRRVQSTRPAVSKVFRSGSCTEKGCWSSTHPPSCVPQIHADLRIRPLETQESKTSPKITCKSNLAPSSQAESSTSGHATNSTPQPSDSFFFKANTNFLTPLNGEKMYQTHKWGSFISCL